MSNSDLFSILFVLLLLASLAQVFGYLFVRLHQPKVIGEILAGIVLGPAVMGRFPFLSNMVRTADQGHRISLVIVLAVGVAVTSVPVVSKIFADLKILHTRFARLILGVAVLEDIVLWLALAVATAVAGQTVLNVRALSLHLITTVGFFALGLTILPLVVKRINKTRLNVFAQRSPVAYAILVLLAYCAMAGALDVSLVFAAFLAGFAVVHKKRRLFAEALDAIGKVSFAFFIPVYFALVSGDKSCSKAKFRLCTHVFLANCTRSDLKRRAQPFMA